MRLPLAELRLVARKKADGYMRDLLAAGRVEDGWLILPKEDYRRIRQKYSGIGDKLAIVFQPIARVLDSVAGTNLRNCGGCAKRQKALNQLTARD